MRMLKLYGKQKKTYIEIGSLPKSLEDAICCFILNGAIKKIKDDVSEKHDTMLVNMTHFNDLQIKVQVEEYLER